MHCLRQELMNYGQGKSTLHSDFAGLVYKGGRKRRMLLLLQKLKMKGKFSSQVHQLPICNSVNNLLSQCLDDRTLWEKTIYLKFNKTANILYYKYCTFKKKRHFRSVQCILNLACFIFLQHAAPCGSTSISPGPSPFRNQSLQQLDRKDRISKGITSTPIASIIRQLHSAHTWCHSKTEKSISSEEDRIW